MEDQLPGGKGGRSPSATCSPTPPTSWAIKQKMAQSPYNSPLCNRQEEEPHEEEQEGTPRDDQGLGRRSYKTMEDQLPGRTVMRSPGSPSTTRSPTPPTSWAVKQEADHSPHNSSPCRIEEEEPSEGEYEEEAPQDDQQDDSGRGDATTQTEQPDDFQIKEEEEPVEIDPGYANDYSDPSWQDVSEASQSGGRAMDEYGQPADKPKQFICSECGKGFSLYSYLTKHQRSHSDEKPYTCIECNKCFRYKPSLVAHQRVHTGEKPFACTECGKLFVTKFNLKAHEKVHTGEKPVQCPACGRCFSNNPALVKHLRIHTGEKPFSCSVCNKVFASKSCLNAHQVIHTGERPYMCAECGKAFANQSNLISHRIIHTGQKPYTCPQCGRGFANQSNLAKHKMTHTDIKPFICIECGNLFARKEGLAKHFERIHKKKLEF